MPEMDNVLAAVKFLPVKFAAATVTLRVAGVNVQPDLVGVRVYVPGGTLAIV